MKLKNESLILQALTDRYDELMRSLTKKLGSEDRAREALHDTWLHLEKADAVPETVVNPKAFLLRVAENLALDRTRRETWLNRITDVLDELELADGLPGPAENLENLQAIRTLTAALIELPKRQREILIALKYEGYSRSEIATRLGISKRMVSYELAAALDFCHAYLSSGEKA